MLPASDLLDPAVPVRRVEEAVAEEYRTASGEYLGIGYDPRRRRAPEQDTEGPRHPHVGNGKEGREKAPGGAGDAA